MKHIILIFFFQIFINHLLAQTQYVITNQLNVREKPDVGAKVLGSLKLGDSVIVLGNSETKITATINGLKVTASWAKIKYEKQIAWVFGGGLCYQILKPDELYTKYYDEEMAAYSIQLRNDIQRLLKDSILFVGGDYIKLRAKTGKEVIVRHCYCMIENLNCQQHDGYQINSLEINTQNPDLVEVTMSAVAFTIKVYVNLKTGKKFNFPQSQECMESAISPDGKYVLGIPVLSEKTKFLLFDFDTRKVIKQLTLNSNSFQNSMNWKWLNNQEVEMIETEPSEKKRILLIPQMQWKE